MKKNLLILIAVIIITIVPLISKSNSEFSGADGEAQNLIEEIDSNYQPWFESIWEPPSGEIESLLFALQAALGASVIAFGFGYAIGKKNKIQ